MEFVDTQKLRNQFKTILTWKKKKTWGLLTPKTQLISKDLFSLVVILVWIRIENYQKKLVTNSSKNALKNFFFVAQEAKERAKRKEREKANCND